jgi:hypothetical protein
MEPNVRPRQLARLLVVVAVTLVVGTIAFRETLHESWFQSFYRSVVTLTLTGLDSIPTNDSARIVSLVLVVAGVTLIAYAGAVIFESIAGGVLTGALAEPSPPAEKARERKGVGPRVACLRRSRVSCEMSLSGDRILMQDEPERAAG